MKIIKQHKNQSLLPGLRECSLFFNFVIKESSKEIDNYEVFISVSPTNETSSRIDDKKMSLHLRIIKPHHRAYNRKKYYRN